MQRRKLGSTGFDVAPLAFGGNVFGWTADEPASFRLLDAFVGAGFNLIDTANSYSRWVPGHAGGESETVIGNWIARRGRHDDVIVATKVGSDVGLGYRCLRRDCIMREAEASLRRLKVEAIDLYQSHWDDDKTPFEETLDAYARLIEQGKARAIGASNLTAPRLQEALDAGRRAGLPTYATLQPQYNLCVRNEFEGPLAELCIREGLGVISYFALAAGFLTGKYRSDADLAKSPRGAGVKKFLDARGMRILAALDRVSQRFGATPAQVSLAWLLSRPAVTAPIVSATSTDQLDEIVASTRLSLDDDALRELDEASRDEGVAPGGPIVA
ncbi:MAG TPA: aldo/keto reductase [Casimicrobiaceae bacterium]|nr:aldo/keto reductase [Casimicrobiaceae bacterium]